jgi:serine/arginine repetitive matrix protein 2
MPIDEDDERFPSASSSRSFTPQYRDPSPVSSSSKELMIESEVSPDVTPSNVPASPSSVTALSNNPSNSRTSDDSGSSPQMYTTRLPAASRMQADRSPLNADFGEVEEGRPVVIESTSKRPVDGGSTSTWEKVKNTFGGRRSRTNSIITRDRRDNTDSSVSRESGASLVSPKPDKDISFAQQQNQAPVMQIPSASASILSLSPHSAPRGGNSPVPPPSAADLLKYQDAKLFPFPGMKMLEEQRNRAKIMSPSASSPEISMPQSGDSTDQVTNHSGSSSNTPSMTVTPEQSRERKLSHQASDTRLLAKYGNLNSPALSATPSSSSHLDYFNVSPQPTPQAGSSSLKLPMNREGVKMWLKAKTLFSSQGSSPSTSSPSTADTRVFKTDKKPSLSDLLRARKENDLIADWEDIGSEKSRTPTSTTASTLRGKQVTTTDVSKDVSREHPINGLSAHMDNTDNEQTLRTKETNGHTYSSYSDFDGLVSKRAPSEHPSSATPDPLSSIEDYPAQSTSESSSTTSSQYSHCPSRNSPSKGAVVLERLDEMLGRGSRSPMWAGAIEDPPRKLLLSSPVLQVANANTVKDRFLFLFSDILVIAKPIVHDHNQLLQMSRPSPLDRKYVVKSVVLLRNLRFNADREEPRTRMSNYTSSPRHPLLRTFVHQFAKDPDHAITTLFEKSGTRDDPVVLGQLLFKTLDVDRVRLGDYLSRRTSKLVLKAYLDAFGFTGLRVDRSLRVFLLSIHVPGRTTHAHGPLEYLLDAFATRWYEANAESVAYDKDLAIRLVRALVQLNDVMHGGIAQEPGATGYPRRNVTSKEFTDAFRRFDARALVSDELLDNVYNSIRRERLSHARNHTSSGSSDIHVAIKRVLPPRLTYRVQSEPIVLRIPQPDPYLTIHLYGQDLLFDPPLLSFAKSSEASFRVTGTSLGFKTMIMCRAGANALKYGGLPLSSLVVIERAFMRNTFQVAFLNQKGEKRRYMFSIDDPLIRHQWTVSLKRQIEYATSSANSSQGSSVTQSTFYQAAENTSFKVLQEVLLGTESSTRSGSSPGADNTRYATRSPVRSPIGDISKRPLSPYSSSRADEPQLTKVGHARSKSRSKVYHRHGPGKLEVELNLSDDERDSPDFDDEMADDGGSMLGQGVSSRSGVRLWSGRDLEMQCQQNSSIALVLSYLQVGSPDHDSRS